MSNQDLFEKDYSAAFPGVGANKPEWYFAKIGNGEYAHQILRDHFAVWLQQAKRHEAEVAELVDVLALASPYVECSAHDAGYKAGAIAAMTGRMHAAIAKYEVKKL